ncbi:MAG: hypothetical protein IKI23_13770, partial [Lachnospiraceae bacterium]|nr:hypothetical protein [Lachnospiraceae bacterium]
KECPQPWLAVFSKAWIGGVEKRIAIVFSDVIREIYKMRGGKVVNSNLSGPYGAQNLTRKVFERFFSCAILL